MNKTHYKLIIRDESTEIPVEEVEKQVKRHEDDTHKVINRGDYFIIVNPCEAFETTIVTARDYTLSGTRLSAHPVDIDTVIEHITEGGFDYISRINHNTCTLERAGSGEMYEVNFGDAELTEAFLQSVEKACRVNDAWKRRHIHDIIKDTINQFHTGLVNKFYVYQDVFHVYLDGDFDDYEYFMEELCDNLPDYCTAENTLDLNKDICHVEVFMN